MKRNKFLKTVLILTIGALTFFTSCKKEKNEPVTPPVVTANIKIQAGGGHSFLVKPDGTLWGVGYNDLGQLGSGNTANSNSWIKVNDNIKAASAGYQHSLILKNDNTVWATGLNTSGQLGDGTIVNKSIYAQVATGAKEIYAGYYSSFIIKNDNTLWAAGGNAFGELGETPTGLPRTSFIQVATDIKSVAMGANHTLFLKTDNTVWAAGANNSGQLGIGTLGGTSNNKLVKIADNAKAVAAGNLHSLILKNDNTLWSCGLNDNGQLGNGTTTLYEGNLVQIATNVQAIKIGPRGYNIYALKTDNSLWACGWNAYGQLANSNNSNQASLIKVTDNVTDFSAGYAHLLLMKTDKTIWACGADDIGQIGDGTIGSSKNTLVKVVIP